LETEQVRKEAQELQKELQGRIVAFEKKTKCTPVFEIIRANALGGQGCCIIQLQGVLI